MLNEEVSVCRVEIAHPPKTTTIITRIQCVGILIEGARMGCSVGAREGEEGARGDTKSVSIVENYPNRSANSPGVWTPEIVYSIYWDLIERCHLFLPTTIIPCARMYIYIIYNSPIILQKCKNLETKGSHYSQRR